MDNFRTRIDFTDRQAKQYEKTDITLSGKTSFGLPYSSITSGPDLTITGETFSDGLLVSTFTGTTGSTIYVFGDPRMSIDEGDLVPLTPTNSGDTQFAGPTWIGYDMFTTVDGYTGWTNYSSVTYTIDVTTMLDLGGGNYSGDVISDFIVYSASSLDYTGRTIWVDVSGITRTDELIVSKEPTIGYVLTCVDSDGRVAFQPTSGGTTGGTDNNGIYDGSGSLPLSTTTITMGEQILQFDNGELFSNRLITATDTNYGLRLITTQGTSSPTGQTRGVYTKVIHSGTGVHNVAYAQTNNVNIDSGTVNYALATDNRVNAIGDVGLAVCTYNKYTNSSTGTTTTAVGSNARINNSGLIDRAFGFFVGDWTDTGTINESAAIKIESNTNVGTGVSWSIISESTAPSAFVGSMGIGMLAEPDDSAILALSSTTKGFQPPQMTSAQKTAIVSPTDGLMVYDDDKKDIEFYNGTVWVGEKYATGATLYGTTLYFDRNDGLSAFTADLSALSGGTTGGTSGTTFWEETGTSNTALKDNKGGHTILNVSTNSMIAGGNSNVIESSLVSFIGGGAINKIETTSSASGIVAGTGNTIGGSTVYSFIGGGQLHTMGPDDVTNSTIIAGSGHTINGSASGFGDRNAIVGGLGNVITGNTDDNFMGGGRYAYMNSRYSAMVGGTDNIIQFNTGISATTLGSGIFAGDTNIIDGSETSTILGGNINTITTATDSTIVGGNNHTITSSNNSAIIGGTGAQIFKKNSAIIGGINNTVFGESAIVAGGTGNTATANYSTVLGGFDNNTGDWGTVAYGSGNIINSGTYSIVGGADNTITAGAHAVVIGGFNNSLTTSQNSSIIGGDDNIISSTGNVLGMMATAFSTISGTASYSSIIGGFDHIMSAGTKSLILGGDNNRVGGSASLILGGAGNEIFGGGIIAGSASGLISSGADGGIISSNGSEILSSSGGFIAASSSSSLDGGDNSAIIAGNANLIDSGDNYNAIMAGSANTITSAARRTAIIGGVGITGDVSDTVYVPSLNIGTVKSGTSVSTLGVNANGTVISGITKEFFVNPTGISAAIKGSFYCMKTDGATGESVYMNGSVPDDFVSTVSVEALVIPDFTATEATSLDCHYGAVGAVFSATTNTSSISPSYVTNDFMSLDVSAVFSAITSGDIFGFEINQTNGNALNVVGLKLKYKAK